MPRPLTFGIEFEFAFATIPCDLSPPASEKNDGLPLAMRSCLPSSQGPALLHEAFDAINKVLSTFGLRTKLSSRSTRVSLRSHDKTHWHLDTDATIEGPNCDYHWLQIELISPVLQLIPTGIAEAMQVAGLIKRHFRVSTNDSTGMHVHIGDSSRGFPLEVCQKVMGFFYTFDTMMEPLHPPSRRDHHWARNIRDAFQLSISNSWSVSEALEAIFETTSIEELDFGFGGRRPAVNLKNLRNGGVLRKKKTIEFRQHAGTLESERVEAWIKTVGGIVDWCRRATDTEYIELVEDSAEQQDQGDAYAPGTAVELLKAIGLKEPAKYYGKRLKKNGGKEQEGELITYVKPLSEEYVVDSSSDSSDSSDSSEGGVHSGDEEMVVDV